MTDTSQDYDVAVVGFGPVGAVAVGLLSRSGLRTVVIETRETVFPQPRAIALDHEIMRVLQAIGAADAVLPRLGIYGPTEYVGADGLPIARYMSRPREPSNCWESNYLFIQPELEGEIRASIARMNRQPTIFLGTRLVDLQLSADEYVLQVEAASGSRHIRAKYVLGCDGGNSSVRRSIGAELESLSFDRPFVVVDALVKKQALARLPQDNVQYCDPRRPATYVVGPANLRRWEIMQLPTETDEVASVGSIEKILDRWMAKDEYELFRSASYIFHALIAKQWRRGGVFLLGDAAHQTPPFLGQGMCQGIRDAFNLCWKLEWVLRGMADDRLLDSYEAERMPHVRVTTEAAIRLGSVICELDEQRAIIRDQESRKTFGNPPRTVFRQSLIPNLEFGAISKSAPGRGALFPQPMVCSQARGDCRLDDVTGPSLRILTTRERASELPPPGKDMLKSADGVVVVAGAKQPPGSPEEIVVEDAAGVVAEWLSQNDCCAVLVRPDNYVFGGLKNGSDLEPLLREFLQHVR